MRTFTKFRLTTKRLRQMEDGSIAPLIVTYFVIIMTAIFLISNVASTYIARRELLTLTETALSRAVQELDEFVYYYQVPVTGVLEGGNQFVPINCSDAGQTLSRELRLFSTSVDGSRESTIPVIVDFNCDGRSLTVVVEEIHSLPFALPVFGISTYKNQIRVSAESRYN